MPVCIYLTFKYLNKMPMKGESLGSDGRKLAVNFSCLPLFDSLSRQDKRLNSHTNYHRHRGEEVKQTGKRRIHIGCLNTHHCDL